VSISRLIASRIGMEESGSRVFRRRRFMMFLDLMDAVLARKGECRIMDVGGEGRYWAGLADMLGDRRFHVTLLNPEPVSMDDKRFTALRGDARDISDWPDMSFDIVHSNSVIEHVGHWWDMAAMAREVRRLAPTYYVQTPYYWFPVEPHCSTAFFHWMPESVRVSMLMRRARGVWGKAPDVDSAMRQIHSAVLLDRRMMTSLFPDAEIHNERVAGLTKSLIAIRRQEDVPALGAVQRGEVGRALDAAGVYAGG
jgi:hypothetical protein